MRSRWHYILRGGREHYHTKLLIPIGVPFLVFVSLVGMAFAAGIPGGRDLPRGEAVYTASSTALPTEKATTPTTRSQTTEERSKEQAQRKPPRGSCSDPLVIVDRQHALPSDYEPKALVSLSTYGIPKLGSDKLLKEEAARHLSRMLEEAGDIELVVDSAYRSYSDQQVSYAYWSDYYGDSDAGGVSAPPGYSEHQLGTTVDLTNAAAGYELTQRFGYTKAARWLKQNAWKYGFAPSYPRDRMGETGYPWEPWHFRYIGEENARKWHNSGIVLHEFLQRNGVRPGC